MNRIASAASEQARVKPMCYTMITYQPWNYLLQFGCHTISAANHIACPITTETTHPFI